MPLPVGGPWPPKSILPCSDALAVWSAWYSGDPNRLDAVYGGTSAYETTSTQTQLFNPRGGLFDTMRVSRSIRYFWGAPTPAGEQRAKLHVPLAGDLAGMSADLLFSEQPDIKADTDTTQARLDEYVENGLWPAMREAAEAGAALGGVYLRIVWDADVAPTPWVTGVHADAAIPEWTWDRLTAVTFWRVISEDGQSIVRHLERHEPGAILHGVYVGDKDTLGRRAALADYPATERLGAALGTGDAIQTGTRLLTAVYVPNMRPNRIWRDVPAAAQLGRSDFAGVEILMDALDEAWSSWMRDIRLGKARLVADRTATESLGRGQGSTFDADREVFLSLPLGPNAQAPITPVQFAIRVTEHQQTTAELMQQIVRGAGYSMQTFGGTGDTAITATEVAARERQSLKTRGKKIGYWAPALAQVLEVLLAVDQAKFGAGVTVERPTIEFPDAVSSDPKDVAQTLVWLTTANVVSTKTAVQMLHPDWDEDQIAEEVGQINSASSGGLDLTDAARMHGPNVGDPDAGQPGREASTAPRPAG